LWGEVRGLEQQRADAVRDPVDPAKALDRPFQAGLDLSDPACVENEGNGADLRRERLELLGVAPSDQLPVAPGRESPREGRTDAAGGAEDDDATFFRSILRFDHDGFSSRKPKGPVQQVRVAICRPGP
jgi:hypothetical protein